MKLPYLLFLVLVMHTHVYGQPVPTMAELSAYLDELAANHKAMGAVAVYQGDSLAYEHYFGQAVVDKGKAIDKNSLFRIGSITKTFTAVLVFQQIEKGTLSLETKLADYFPGVPNARDITIDHLLSHQSGIYNYTNAPDFVAYLSKPKTGKELINIIASHKPDFQPGTSTAYSNSNYVLLGFVLEEVTGLTYAELVRQQITNPLKLKHTYVGKGAVQPQKQEVFSYKHKGNGWTKATETDMSIPGAAGNVVSNVRDLNRFIQALFEGRLVNKTSLEQMTDFSGMFGKGLLKFPFHDKTAYGHNGGIDGYQSNVSYFQQEDVSMAVTVNAMDYNFNNLLIAVLSVYFEKAYAFPSVDTTSVSLTGEEMAQFTGNYVSDQLPLDIRVFTENDQLMAQATGQPSFPLTAVQKDVFTFEPAGLEMNFSAGKDDQGKYQSFTLLQGGGTFHFKRK